MEESLKYVGRSYPIQDAHRKVTGEMTYISDMGGMTDTFYVKLVLSEIAHGLVKRVDTAEAEAINGVVRIFTHENTPKTCYNSYRTVPEQPLCPEEQRILAEHVRYYGDRVAAVVAKSREAAEAAARKIRVEYEELPVLANTRASSEPGACPIHEGGNLLESCGAEYGEAPELPAEETVLVQGYVEEQRMYHAALENHAYIARYNGDQLTLWTPTQGVFGIRTVVAEYLGLPYARVRVIKAPMGGSFGGKQEFLFEPLLAYLAKELRCTLKLCLDRREDILSTMVRAANRFHFRTVFDREGKFLECVLENRLDAGGYAGSTPDQAHAMLKKLTRQYRIPRYEHKTQVYYTNSVPAGGMRGWGSPEMFTALEIHMNRAARALGMDQVELRRRNCVQPFDVEPLSGLSLGNCRAVDCLDRGAERFGWAEKAKQEPGNGRYRRGIGVACGAHKNGMFGGSPDLTSMTLKMNEDGSLNLIACLHDVGCGTLRSMQIIVAEVLDVDPDSISVTEGDTEVTPFDAGTYGSRITYIAGRCAQLTAESLRKKLLEAASVLMGEPAEELTLRESGVYSAKRNERLSFRRLATDALNQHSTDLIVTETYRAQDNPGVYAAHFVQVEVDTLTGLVRILEYVAAQDVGKAINRGMVEGQIQGGVQMGIGYALCEDTAVQKNGRVSNDTFKKYHIINMYDMPRVEVELIEEGEENGPFGAKSVGEIATVPAAAAVVNAVNNALGTDLYELPLTPEKILAGFIAQKETEGTQNGD